jgi:uncharacterized protein (DUF4415 family)
VAAIEPTAELRRAAIARCIGRRRSIGWTTKDEIEADIASDPDEAGTAVDWISVSIELPKPKASLHMRIDRDVLEFFRQTGRGYQTRINAVLRSCV